MFTVLKSWLFGVPQPLYLSAVPVTGHLSLAGQQNDEVSIAFLHADINAPVIAQRPQPQQGAAVVAIYRGRQSQQEYLREWTAAQGVTAASRRPDTGSRPPPCRGERRVPLGAHDGREALRLHNRRNPPNSPNRQVRPGRSRIAGGRIRLTQRAVVEPCLPKPIVHISRCLSELGQDEPSGGGVVGIGALAGAESLGLSRSIQDMGRGW